MSWDSTWVMTERTGARLSLDLPWAVYRLYPEQCVALHRAAILAVQ